MCTTRVTCTYIASSLLKSMAYIVIQSGRRSAVSVRTSGADAEFGKGECTLLKKVEDQNKKIKWKFRRQ